MKFTLAALSLVAAVSAQSLAGLPTCAQTCALQAIGATGCQVTDAKCICEAQSFLAGVQTCIATACSPADQAATLQFAATFCGAAGVTIPALASSAVTSVVASASSSAAAAASQISDGQVQATSAAPAPTPVTQISDGQIQATSAAAPPSSFTGAAVPMATAAIVQLLGVGAAVIAAL